MGEQEHRNSATAPEGGGRYPILSQVRAFPGLFAGTVGAMVAIATGAILPEVVTVISTTGALVVAAPLAGLALGLGVGWDGEVSNKLAQRLHPVGLALLVVPPVTGLTGGPKLYMLTWISVSGLAFALGSIAIGQRWSGIDLEGTFH